MARLMETLGIDRLSVDDRLQLLEEIWDSLDVSEPPPLTSVQREDLDRRLADFDDDPRAGSSWEEVKARLQGRL